MTSYRERQIEEDARHEIVRICRLLWERGYVAAADGNVSIRLGPDRLLATPSGLSKGFLLPDQMVLTDLKGAPLVEREQTCKGLKPSSELRIHCEAYRQRPDIGAVVHAHPPIAIAFTIAGVSLAQCVLPEVLLSLGSIPTTRYATPTSAQGPEVISDLIGRYDALILDRHGSVTVGATAFEAYLKLEKVEHAAQVTLAARQLGNVQMLPPEEVRRLTAIRRQTLGLPAEYEGEGCVGCGACGRSRGKAPADGEEALVERITRAVLQELGKPAS